MPSYTVLKRTVDGTHRFYFYKKKYDNSKNKGWWKKIIRTDNKREHNIVTINLYSYNKNKCAKKKKEKKRDGIILIKF